MVQTREATRFKRLYMEGGESMNRYLVIADDFTGANDTGVQLVNHGISVNVNLDLFNIGNSSSNSQVIDTETRNASKEKAKETIKKLGTQLQFTNFDSVYKKVDSTLRGNIPTEIKTLVNIYEPEIVVFAPALPSLGRTVEDGTLYVGGERARQTESTKDPLKPIGDDNIAHLLQEVFPQAQCCHYSLASIRQDNFNIHTKARYVSVDTKNDSDLERIIRGVKKDHTKILWVGSAGLMNKLLDVEEKNIPALGLVGSVSNVVKRQLKYAAENGVELISVPIYDVYKKGSYQSYLAKAKAALSQSKDVIIMSSASINRLELKKTIEELQKKGLDPEEISELTQTILSGICRHLVLETQISGVFATGGDTAKGLLDITKAKSVQVLEELQTGVPILQVEGGDFDKGYFITKAGAFGRDDLIISAFKRLHSLLGKKRNKRK